MEQEVIEKAIQYIKSFFADEYSGHDYWHSMRVYNIATQLAKKENANAFIVQLAALLHDVDDIKLSPETHKNKDNAVTFMKRMSLDKNIIRRVCQIINEISYKGSDSVIPVSKEGKCVQDADRLDAIGAIGIARAFAYGGNHNRIMYDPNIKPIEDMNYEKYRNSKSTTVNHFYEKLFNLKNLMNTNTAKKIADKREKIMSDFLEEFFLEWEGKI